MRMGFVPFIGSDKTSPVKASSIPTEYLPGVEVIFAFGLTATDFAILVTAVVLMSVLFALLIVFCDPYSLTKTYYAAD